MTRLQAQLRKAMQYIDAGKPERGDEVNYFYQALGRAGVDGAMQNRISSIFSEGHLPGENKTVRILALGLVIEMEKTGDFVFINDESQSVVQTTNGGC